MIRPRLRSGIPACACLVAVALAGCTIHVHEGAPSTYAQPVPQSELPAPLPAPIQPPVFSESPVPSHRPASPPINNLGARLRKAPVIPAEFTEEFGGGHGIRFRIRNVSIDGLGNIAERPRGGQVWVRMELLHDCGACGNAINQVIIGIAGEDRAQVSVWNGKQRSGGPLVRVNTGTTKQALAEDNPGPAAWVTVAFPMMIPDRPGIWYLRARYAQDYQGNVMTDAGRRTAQLTHDAPLRWWKVDRPQGPDERSNIGAVIVR